LVLEETRSAAETKEKAILKPLILMIVSVLCTATQPFLIWTMVPSVRRTPAVRSCLVFVAPRKPQSIAIGLKLIFFVCGPRAKHLFSEKSYRGNVPVHPPCVSAGTSNLYWHLKTKSSSKKLTSKKLCMGKAGLELQGGKKSTIINY